jgi:hypothetical protein
MQLRQNHEFAPQLAKRGRTVSINDLYRACQEVAARNMMSMEVVRFLDNDTGIIFQGTISIGNFAGQGVPSISAITSAMELELRKITPRFVLELLDQGDIYPGGPQSLRRRGWWRLMSTSGDGRGMKP